MKRIQKLITVLMILTIIFVNIPIAHAETKSIEKIIDEVVPDVYDIKVAKTPLVDEESTTLLEYILYGDIDNKLYNELKNYNYSNYMVSISINYEEDKATIYLCDYNDTSCYLDNAKYKKTTTLKYITNYNEESFNIVKDIYNKLPDGKYIDLDYLDPYIDNMYKKIVPSQYKDRIEFHFDGRAGGPELYFLPGAALGGLYISLDGVYYATTVFRHFFYPAIYVPYGTKVEDYETIATKRLKDAYPNRNYKITRGQTLKDHLKDSEVTIDDLNKEYNNLIKDDAYTYALSAGTDAINILILPSLELDGIDFNKIIPDTIKLPKIETSNKDQLTYKVMMDYLSKLKKVDNFGYSYSFVDYSTEDATINVYDETTQETVYSKNVKVSYVDTNEVAKSNIRFFKTTYMDFESRRLADLDNLNIKYRKKYLEADKDYFESIMYADMKDKTTFEMEDAPAGSNGIFSSARMIDYYIKYGNVYYSNGVYTDIFDNVVYVPVETKKEDYVKVAKERIEKFLNKKVTIQLSNKKLGEYLDSNEIKYFKDTYDNSIDENYDVYNITVDNDTKEYLIIAHEYDGLIKFLEEEDETTGVKVSSTTTELENDLTLTVSLFAREEKYYNEVKENIKSNIITAIDILLESEEQGIIRTLTKDKFTVSFPISEENKDKKMLALYLNGNKFAEKYNVTIKDGAGQFETNHFSEYILVEDNYKLGDLNNNDKIDLSDVLRLLKLYFKNNDNGTTYEQIVGDINGNASYDLADILFLLKMFFNQK